MSDRSSSPGYRIPPLGARNPAPEPPTQSRGWWLMGGLLALTAVLLFIPWSGDPAGPTVDLRTELIWSAVGTVVIGAVALAFPSRWMAYLAMLPTIGAITDLGPVFLPESGQYPWPVKAVTIVLALTGVGWVVSGMRHPAREQSTRWVVAPVAAALVVATLWLPWVIVNGIGPASGQKSAISLLTESAATGAPGVALSRLAIIAIMGVGVAGAVLPLTSRRTGLTRLAMYLSLGASIALVVFTLLLAVRGDAVQVSPHASGVRVALAGFILVTLVWNARLRAAEHRPVGTPTWHEDTGTIPMITQPHLEPPPPAVIQPVPDHRHQLGE